MKPASVKKENLCQGAGDDVSIYPIRRSDRNQITRLYKEAGWWKPVHERQPEFEETFAENS